MRFVNIQEMELNGNRPTNVNEKTTTISGLPNEICIAHIFCFQDGA